MNTSFYVPMIAISIWYLYATIKALRWSTLAEPVFVADNRSRQIVLFNSIVSILFAVGIFTYANQKLEINLRMPSLALGSIVTWQLLSNVLIASYAWKRFNGKPISYNDWRRKFTKFASMANLVIVLMTVFGVQLIDLEKLRKPLAK